MKNVLKLVMALGLVSSQLFALVPPQGTRNPKVEVKAPVVVAPVIEVVEEAPVVVAPAVVVKPAAKGLLAKFKALSTAQKVAVVAGTAAVVTAGAVAVAKNTAFDFNGKYYMPKLKQGKKLSDFFGADNGLAVAFNQASDYVFAGSNDKKVEEILKIEEGKRTDAQKATLKKLEPAYRVRFTKKAVANKKANLELFAKEESKEQRAKAVVAIAPEFAKAEAAFNKALADEEKVMTDALKALKVEQLKAFVQIKDLLPALKEAAVAELKALDVVLEGTDSLPEVSPANNGSSKE